MEVRDIEIKASWGKIALKLWGDENNPAVFAIHGVTDNAGTFDTIIPLLPNSYFYICVDLPGHGKSDHFPPDLPIHTINYIIVYQMVLDHFKRQKYIIMGHSYGAQIGYLYAQLYPERVEKLIMFDTVHFYTVPSKYFKEYLAKKFDEHFKLREKLAKGHPPQYTYEEAFDKMMSVRPSPLTEEAAHCLLKRMLIPKDNGKFELSLDQRLKFHFINPIHDSRYAVETIKQHPVRCPILMVFGKDNPAQRQILKPILDELKRQKNITIKFLPGHHDVHLTDAKNVAPLVVKFLNLQKSKL